MAGSKKRKRSKAIADEPRSTATAKATADVEAAFPRARSYTVSLALPGSIVANAQSAELKTYLAGQIARACTVFNVDEVVVFSENGKEQKVEGRFDRANKSDPNVFLARVLQYLETPQYLRKALFPMHPDLQYAGLLNPLDAPHHLRADAISTYREGVTLNRPGTTAMVNVGLKKDVRIDVPLPPNIRVTVRIDEPASLNAKKFGTGTAVPPAAPRETEGLYWGYTTRLAGGLGKVFSECPYAGGYDLALGTSEHGDSIVAPAFRLAPFRHLLVVFGGLGGLESCVEGDESLPSGKVEELFDGYLNTCPQQGSGTIRTEEAILVSMALLQPHILANAPPLH